MLGSFRLADAHSTYNPLALQAVASRAADSNTVASSDSFTRTATTVRFGSIGEAGANIDWSGFKACWSGGPDDPAIPVDAIALDAERQNMKLSAFYRFPEALRAVGQVLEERFKTDQSPIKTLVVGVGNGQEPMSYLTIIDAIARKHKKPLKDCVDLNLVEYLGAHQIRPYPYLGYARYEDTGSSVHGTGDFAYPPPSTLGSFDETADKGFKVKPHIEAIFNESLHSETKGLFGAGIDDVAGCEDRSAAFMGTPMFEDGQQYDLISCNRVLPYIKGYPYGHAAIGEMLLKQIAPGGVLVIDPKPDHEYKSADIETQAVMKMVLARNDELARQFTEITPGVYQRNKAA